MSLKLNGREYQGRNLWELFPHFTTDRTAHKWLMKKMAQHVREGNQIHIELLKGAKKGSVARLDITAEQLEAMYEETRNGYGEVVMARRGLRLVFDDRANVIEVAVHQGERLAALVLFDRTETSWVFTTKAATASKKPPLVLHDHFGVELTVGQLVLFPEGAKGDTRTRFGFIKSITDKGTIKVESIQTREGHDKVERNLSPTVRASDLVVLDAYDSLKGRVMMAKLMHA